MYTIIVKFEVEKKYLNEFKNAIVKNAQMSMEEVGCFQFDVFIDKSEVITLYEVYRDQKAFDFHLSSTHFKSFSEETAHMVRDKSVEPFEMLYFSGK